MTCFLRTLAAVIVASGLAGCGAASPTDTGREVVSAAVTVATPVHGALPRTVAAWGQVSPGPSFQQVVSVAADGALVSLHVAQGEHVSRGQVLGRFILAGNAQAASEQAATSLGVATASLERVKRLRADSLATDEQLALAEKTVRDARAAVAALPEAAADGGLVVKAPVDGTITILAVVPGQVVPANGALLSITPSSQRVLACGAEPRSARVIKTGMPVTMTPVDGGDAVAGKVMVVGDAIDPQSHLVPVRIEAEQAPMAGSAWRADITVGSVEGWIVPADAVIEEGDSHFVYQVQHGKARRVPVTIAVERNDRMAVNGAIDPTSPLVIAGAPQLSDGMTVATGEGAK